MPQLLKALRTKGWVRTVAIRRLIAVALVGLALFLAWRPNHATEAQMLVAAHDLAPGTTLSTSDLKLVRAPPSLIPRGALTDVQAAAGQVLAGVAAAGEPITSARLLGPENTRLTAGSPDAAAVPIRLADEGVAELLVPGARVDIVAPDQTVLASAATVVTVRPARRAHEQGWLVVVALPGHAAPRVAAASLAREVTVTLR
ncbi:SAF domain-containing protein [Kibdelosporangium philippinense]|uniref:SAF domain-containing protein n=1 Tax=Kibdelosporangium philippinense TaxID=211113 RepID=A0ABS8ZMM2_9PSEU|nr:SAF domain-containing protein [Kibdelosporangium philippinense]MCE7008799.1 SAF domain-containing protein [Kibdelosporangium philippinense]